MQNGAGLIEEHEQEEMGELQLNPHQYELYMELIWTPKSSLPGELKAFLEKVSEHYGSLNQERIRYAVADYVRGSSALTGVPF